MSCLTGQGYAEEKPPFDLLRFEEDGRKYEDLSKNSLLDHLKFISFGSDSYASLGGEARWRWDRIQNPDFGDADPKQNDAWLQRYALHSDLVFSDQFRVFIQLMATTAHDREGGSSPVDETGLEFQNLFVDVHPTDRSTLRLGRQELKYGSGRLIHVREGPNVRRNFVAGKLILNTEIGDLEAVYAQPIAAEQGSFNDERDPDQTLWLLYLTQGATPLHSQVEWYYIGRDSAEESYLDANGKESRHSFGSRLDGSTAELGWNIEAVYQAGDFSDQSIKAWTLASKLTWEPDQLPADLSFGLSLNVASGDDDPNDGTLGTFNPLYPRGSYFSEAAVLGPRNFYNIQPSLSFQFLKSARVSVDTNFFWRLETEDGIYGPSGNLVRGPEGSTESYVGQTVSATFGYAFSREISFDAIYTHFFAGDFIEDTGPSDDLDFVELTLTYKF